MMGLMCRSFNHVDEDIQRALQSSSMPTPGVHELSMTYYKNITAIKKVQLRATKYLPTLKNLTYEECLQKPTYQHCNSED